MRPVQTIEYPDIEVIEEESSLKGTVSIQTPTEDNIVEVLDRKMIDMKGHFLCLSGQPILKIKKQNQAIYI